jgi:hypothetical protein
VQDFYFIISQGGFCKFMRKIRVISVAFLCLMVRATPVEASFYSVTCNKDLNYEELLASYHLVVFTSKNCSACKTLQLELQKCSLPGHFKIAWVGSQVMEYKFYLKNFDKIKTREKTIQKLTHVTPKTFLMGRPFKEGVFNCKELESSI